MYPGNNTSVYFPKMAAKEREVKKRESEKKKKEKPKHYLVQQVTKAN